MGGRAKRRVALSLLAGAALTGALALAGAPAFGQAAGVGNTGDASANSGGNSSVGNASDNVATTSTATENPPAQPLLGGLLGLVLNLGGTTNTSSGTSTVNSGPATAGGNTSDTAVGQSGGGAVGTVFSPFAPAQTAGVSNSGSGQANTGGNRGVGNDSNNVATNTQTVQGGLLAVGINLLNNVSNTSNGTSSIATGPATASGNEAVTTIDQTGGVFGVGGGFVCDGFFRFGGQRVDVSNAGSAAANTGNNASVGNQSENVAINNQNVSGGLIGLGVNLLNNTSNRSDGTSGIATGPATASGNRSTTAVTQEPCVIPVAQVTPPAITPTAVALSGTVAGQQLAKTGVDPFVMGLIAFVLLFGGLLFLVWERVESFPADGPFAV